MQNYLIYNFSGELDDISHLFLNDRLGQISFVAKEPIKIWDRGNINDLISYGKEEMEILGKLAFHDTTVNYLQRVDAEANQIIAQDVDRLFLNLWQGSGFKFSMDLAHSLKKRNPNLKIFGIGQKVDWFKEAIFSLNPDIDGLILGLEHESIKMMLEDVNEQDIPNLVINHKNEGLQFTQRKSVDVNNYPYAKYAVQNYIGIEGKIPMYTISLSNQACSGSCAFCVRPENYGRNAILRSTTNVVDELEHLIDIQNGSCFRIGDSTPPAGSLTKFAHAIVDRGIHNQDIYLSGFARIDVNSKENFELIRKAKIGALFFGIESLDDDNLIRLRKNISYDNIKRTLKLVHESGIFTVGSFIFPIPGETEKSMKVCLERINEIKDYLDSLLILPAGVYPPTDWGRNPDTYGITLAPKYYEEMAIYPVKYLLPINQYPPFPFSYPFMGKPAKEANYDEIISYSEQFRNIVRKEIGIPAIPDYYWTLANCLKINTSEFTEHIVNLMIDRDYEAIRNVISDLRSA